MSKSSEEGAAGNGSVQEAGNGSQKDTNGNIYENRAGTKKIIRVVTVMAYVFSVSFAAILLSAYYVFLWEPPNPRLQRHPLSGDPQVDFLMDSLLSNKNLNNYNESDDQRNGTPADTEEYENPSKKFNNILFERIMTNDQEPIINYPQKLIAFQDFAKFYHRTNVDGDAADPTTIEPDEDSSQNTLTTLSILFKALRTIPTELTEHEVDGKNIGEKKLSDSIKIGENIEPLKEPWSIEIRDENEERIESRNLNRLNAAPEIVNNETTQGSSIKSNNLTVMSTRDLSATIYPGIDNRSYPEAIGATTVENNKVTIATDNTIEVPNTSRLPVLEDDNFEVSLRNENSRLSEDPLEEEIPTTKSEIQIYPGELNARDILDDRK